MDKISWVCKKNINFDQINLKINDCIETKHFTNNGKNVLELRKKIKTLFKINDNKEVLMVCNGAMGINTLISGLNIHFNKKLRWVVQSFTFPCSVQGSLMDSIVLDIDENMGPDINKLHEIINDYDGILITNCFGCSTNIKLYEDFCAKNNKMLLFDNAATSMTYYDNQNILNYGNGCMVSLHHTKPIGFGEGGFIIFDKNLLDAMEKTICFGYTATNKLEFNENASNYKMSELAAIYICDYVENVNKIYDHHTKMISYFQIKLKEFNLDTKVKLFPTFSNYNEALCPTIPILFNEEPDINIFLNNNIEAKKYYYPLDKNALLSVKLFTNIICLPLNLDIDELVIDRYINIIKNYVL
jgi:dTDP-4-amino-4,6-dideoxygalactose transaminase